MKGSLSTEIAKQFNLFLIAIGFFSRLPVTVMTEYSEQRLNQANRYFGVVGWLLGAIVAAGFVLFSWYFPEPIALFLAMVLSLLLTGAFHEDGLADMFDGFGGGFTAERKLEIMKDSRLGTYGSCALFAALSGKFLLLSHVQDIVVAVLVAYPLSRVVAASFIFDMPYVSDLDKSKSKPLATRQSFNELMILLFTGAVALFIAPEGTVLTLIIALLVFRIWFKRFLLKQINGFTGDCLGASVQLSELLIYLVLVAL